MSGRVCACVCMYACMWMGLGVCVPVCACLCVPLPHLAIFSGVPQWWPLSSSVYENFSLLFPFSACLLFSFFWCKSLHSMFCFHVFLISVSFSLRAAPPLIGPVFLSLTPSVNIYSCSCRNIHFWRLLCCFPLFLCLEWGVCACMCVCVCSLQVSSSISRWNCNFTAAWPG